MLVLWSLRQCVYRKESLEVEQARQNGNERLCIMELRKRGGGAKTKDWAELGWVSRLRWVGFCGMGVVCDATVVNDIVNKKFSLVKVVIRNVDVDNRSRRRRKELLALLFDV